MDVVCEKCGAVYDLDLNQVTSDSVRVKCSSCGHMFRVYKSSQGSAPVHVHQPAPVQQEVQEHWFVRYKDGVVARVPDLATLQRWIVERKIGTEDQLSQDEHNWSAAGAFPNLQPFFQVLDQLPAAASASLMSPMLQSMSPRETLGFGAGQEGKSNPPAADASQATEFSLQAPTGTGSYAAETSQPTAVTANQPAIASQSTEYSLQSAAPQDNSVLVTRGSGHADEDQIPVVERQIESLAPHTPPSNGQQSQPTSDGWYLGGTEPADHNNDVGSFGEPSFGSDSFGTAEPAFGFGDYEQSYDDDYDDDFDVAPSSKGKWIVATILVLGLIAGGIQVVKPELYALLAVKAGLQEATPSTLKKVAKARKQLDKFQPKAFKKAAKILKEAQEEHGDTFPTYEAANIEMEITKARYKNFHTLLFNQKIKSQNEEVKKLREALGQLKDEDPQKVLMQQKLKQQVEKLNTLQNKRSEVQRQFQARWEKAKKLLKKTQHPNHPHIRLNFLRFYVLSRDPKLYKDNLKKLREELQEDKHQGEIDKIQAVLAVNTKNQSGTDKWLTKLIKKDKKAAFPKFLMLKSMLDKNRPKGGLQTARSILSDNAEHPLASKFKLLLDQPAPPPRLRAPGEGNKTTDPKGKTDPRKGPAPKLRVAPKPRPRARVANTYKGLYHMGRRYFNRERYSRAVKYYRLALKKKNTSRARSGLGWALMELNKTSSAKREFDKAMSMSKRNSDAYYGLATYYRRKGNTGKARTLFKQYLKKFPRSRDAGEVRLILKNLR